MSEYSWICPACDRRVPARLNICRCGFEQDPALIPGSALYPAEPAASNRAFGGIVPLVVGAVVLVGLAAFIATRVFRPETAPAAAVLTPEQASKTALPATSLPPADSNLNAPVVNETPTVTDSTTTVPIEVSSPTVPGVAAPSSLEDVISGAIPAVVSIETSEGRGSGFFVNPGVIITNRHVIGGNVSVTVRMPTGSSVHGRVERSTADVDLAIVRVDGVPPSQPLLQLGSAEDVRVGQEVIAIGLAMGQFQNTVTRGIISAVRRTGTGSGVVLLQTDAAINPGNSGGPLIDRRGRVVGITTLKVTGVAESLGFAIAADHARAFLAGGNAQAPAIASNAPNSAPLAPAFSSKSNADVMREQGLKAFEESLRTVATRAAEIDNYWTEIKRECGGRAAGAYDHEWFALWENRLTVSSSNSWCLYGMKTVGQRADQLRTGMITLNENARRAGVYPGDLRQARSKYHLDWNGWDR